jgi:hypothetical protein
MAALLAYVGVKSKTAMLLLLNSNPPFMCSANKAPTISSPKRMENQNGD